MGSKEGTVLVPTVTASFTPGQTGQHAETQVMTLEGNSSHLRLVVERNFPFNTCHLHLLQHQLALRPGTESNRPQEKPDTSMLHPQIPLGDGAAHTGGDQITSHPSSPHQKNFT